MNKLEVAFSLFDGYNMRCPQHISWQGKDYPLEYFYALKLYEWVKKLSPAAAESLLLASRCQHIGRWEIARNTYPEGRVGYLKWRSDLAKYHAKIAEGFLREAGYDQEMIDSVREIVLKQKIKHNPAVQTMENALCLVFLEFQYDELISRHTDEKLIGILRKTWAKMSSEGQEAALGLAYSNRGKELIKMALAG
ncbi:DUF4202 domain-containing protein [Dyadobacter helix]|nr:DUF4202 domain-containing protein [Dyadobacter sp. CECT 9275]